MLILIYLLTGIIWTIWIYHYKKEEIKELIGKNSNLPVILLRIGFFLGSIPTVVLWPYFAAVNLYSFFKKD